MENQASSQYWGVIWKCASEGIGIMVLWGEVEDESHKSTSQLHYSIVPQMSSMSDEVCSNHRIIILCNYDIFLCLCVSISYSACKVSLSVLERKP